MTLFPLTLALSPLAGRGTTPSPPILGERAGGVAGVSVGMPTACEAAVRCSGLRALQVRGCLTIRGQEISAHTAPQPNPLAPGHSVPAGRAREKTKCALPRVKECPPILLMAARSDTRAT